MRDGSFSAALHDHWNKKRKLQGFAPDRSGEINYSVRTPQGHTYTVCKPGFADNCCLPMEITAKSSRKW